MTEQYGGNYCIRSTDGEPVAEQPCELWEALQAVARESRLRLPGERRDIVQLDTDERAAGERLIDTPATNPESESVIFDLDPQGSNLPPRS
jgi:hypothetical protein